MTSITIEIEEQAATKPRFRAIAGNRQSTGRTAGEALDALNLERDNDTNPALILVQQMGTDPYFSEDQFQRMKELLARRESLSTAEQTELESIAREELMASGRRTQALADALEKLIPVVRNCWSGQIAAVNTVTLPQ